MSARVVRVPGLQGELHSDKRSRWACNSMRHGTIANRGYQLLQSLAKDVNLINGKDNYLSIDKYTYCQETTREHLWFVQIYVDESMFARLVEYKFSENALNFQSI